MGSVSQQAFRQVGTDESRATGDEDLHTASFPLKMTHGRPLAGSVGACRDSRSPDITLQRRLTTGHDLASLLQRERLTSCDWNSERMAAGLIDITVRV